MNKPKLPDSVSNQVWHQVYLQVSLAGANPEESPVSIYEWLQIKNLVESPVSTLINIQMIEQIHIQLIERTKDANTN